LNYYNEFDKGAAAWLRNLIAAGLIPAGDVDERSITEVQPGDVRGYTQCHFFAGIAGWSLALQLAGWGAARPVWTGSCPCQPYSNAGKQLGNADERDLWPAFFSLIAQCQPDTVFGEQVASAIGHGWLDRVSTDLEGEGYACGHVVLGAHSVGAPHQRQRLYWVADSGRAGLAQRKCVGGVQSEAVGSQQGQAAKRGGDHCGLADSDSGRHKPLPRSGDDDAQRHLESRSRLAYPGGEGCKEFSWRRIEPTRPAATVWGNNWIVGADGKTRRIEPGLSPLAHGIPARVVRLRGYGNAIVPPLAAEFIGAFLECAA
jgi:DNA (cytosine-5)-methyltransferase 1